MNAGLLVYCYVYVCLCLLEILLPCGFENLHVTLFPSLELLQRDAKLRCIYLLRQAEPLAYGFDLRSLTPQQKQVIVIQQILQRHFKQLRQLLHMLLRIKVPPCLFVMDVGTAVDARIIRRVTLTKSFLIAIPPQLVRNFRDLRCVRKPQIELLGIQKLMWKDDRELENLKRRNF